MKKSTKEVLKEIVLAFGPIVFALLGVWFFIGNYPMDHMSPTEKDVNELHYDLNDGYYFKRSIMRIRPYNVEIPDGYEVDRIQFNSYNVRIFIKPLK